MATIYVTKYALTSGLEKYEAKISDGMAVTENTSDNIFAQYFHGEGREWHYTKEAALERAEEMRIKKLKSLDKQTKKISAMVFDAP